MYILLTTMFLIINSTMGSALPSMAVPAIAKEWGITSKSQLVLPVSCYLIGYVFGPMFCKLFVLYRPPSMSWPSEGSQGRRMEGKRKRVFDAD